MNASVLYSNPMRSPVLLPKPCPLGPPIERSYSDMKILINNGGRTNEHRREDISGDESCSPSNLVNTMFRNNQKPPRLQVSSLIDHMDVHTTESADANKPEDISSSPLIAPYNSR